MKTIPLLFPVFFLGSLALHAQEPCFRFSDESKSCNVLTPAGVKNLASPEVQMILSDNPRSLDPAPGARYKACWIYGDGNFFFPPDLDSLGDIATLDMEYTYHRSGTYNPMPVLVEKKSNSKPPAYTDRLIQVGPGPATLPTPFVERLSSARKSADIVNNAPLRPKHPTAFAISAPRDGMNTGIYFFYNSKKDSADITFVPDTVLVMDDIRLPDYIHAAVQSGVNHPDSAVLQALGSARFVIQERYRNYIYVPVEQADLDSMPAAFSEYRFFPLLRTIWNNPSLPPSRFLTLVVGNNPPNPDLVETGVLFKTLIQAFGDNSGIGTDFSLPGSDDLFARGADLLEVDMFGSIDPNELQVMEICPAGPDRYRVVLRLEVCNKGYLPENNLEIELRDHSALLSGLTFGQAAFDASVNFDSITHTWRFIWPSNWGGVPNPYDPDADYFPQCQETQFSVLTNWVGVQQLVAGTALEACVTFENAVGNPTECHLNIPLDSTLVLQGFGYQCGGPDTCWTELIFMLCLLVLVILVNRLTRGGWLSKIEPC